MSARDNLPQHASDLGDLRTVLAAGTAIANPPRHHDGQVRPYVVLPEGYQVELLDIDEKPRRKTGTVKLRDAASFIDYFKAHGAKPCITSASRVYATVDPVRFLAVFNDHGSGPDFRDHRADLLVNHSTEYDTWSEHNGKDHAFQGNVAFAEFIEDVAPDIIKPNGADMLQIALNFKVNEQVSFNSASRLENGDVDFAFKSIVQGSSANANGGKVRIPEQFKIEIPVFEGINAKRYPFNARFRYRLREGRLVIWYELERPHKVVEQAFRDLLADIEKGCQSKVLFGSPE